MMRNYIKYEYTQMPPVMNLSERPFEYITLRELLSHYSREPGICYYCLVHRSYHHQDHYDDVIMSAMASQITSLTIVYSIVYSDADQRKYQSSASLAFVRGIHRGSVNSLHKWPVTRKMFPFDACRHQDNKDSLCLTGITFIHTYI